MIRELGKNLFAASVVIAMVTLGAMLIHACQ